MKLATNQPAARVFSTVKLIPPPAACTWFYKITSRPDKLKKMVLQNNQKKTGFTNLKNIGFTNLKQMVLQNLQNTFKYLCNKHWNV